MSAGDGASFFWDLDYGTIGSGDIIEHNYVTAGTYMVTVTAKSAVSRMEASTEFTILEPEAFLYLPAILKP